MAVDFRQADRMLQHPNPEPRRLSTVQRIVVAVLLFMGFQSAVSGLMLLFAPMTLIDQEVDPMLGLGLLMVALGEVAVALVLRRIWRKPQPAR